MGLLKGRTERLRYNQYDTKIIKKNQSILSTLVIDGQFCGITIISLLITNERILATN
jgi:hypothetical protein